MHRRRHYRDIKSGGVCPKSFADSVFVGRAPKAPKSRYEESAEDRRPIIPLVARAGRSHVHGIARPVGEKRESFKKFSDYNHFARLVPAKRSSLPVVCCTRLVNSHTSLYNQSVGENSRIPTKILFLPAPF